MIVDSVEIELRAGRGGDGAVSWRREKYVPKGGPDGGDGGNGGSVILITSHDVDTLSSFRFRKVFYAEDGHRGMNKKKAGPYGQDLELLIPTGTIITNTDTGEIIADLTESGERLKIAKGGRGGRGNVHFASATHQRPTEATPGQPGEVLNVRMELRLVADWALVGTPNAGKSSLLKALTGVDARIGEYAFSTTQPQLGVLKLGKKSIVLIDLPGLLEGAHTGKGLGDKFLQHATRVKGLLHVIDSTDNVDSSVQEIANELKLYGEPLASKPRHLIINKIDLLNPTELKKLKKNYPKAIFVSAVTKENLEQIKKLLAK